MIEAKHTQERWWVDGPPDNQIVWSGPDERVCFLAHSNGRDTDRDIARGHLIAAAPDLLKTLKDVRYRLYGNGPGDPNMDAAIAKAEGRSDPASDGRVSV